MSTSLDRRFLGRIEVWFFAVAAVAIAMVLAYQSYALTPPERCESSGNWWDARTRTCGHVVYLPDITHRPAGAKTPAYPTLPETAAQGAGGTSQVR